MQTGASEADVLQADGSAVPGSRTSADMSRMALSGRSIRFCWPRSRWNPDRQSAARNSGRRLLSCGGPQTYAATDQNGGTPGG